MVKIGTLSTEDLYDMLYRLTPNISNETILHDFYHAFILLKNMMESNLLQNVKAFLS